MPRQNPFSRKTATTYALLRRPQDDPLIHDEDASDHVFHAISGPSAAASSLDPLPSSKIQRRGDLEADFSLTGDVRPNEGEAAEHGVYFDDTKYDYMQHMRDLGGASGAEVAWIEAPQKGKQKVTGKGKQTLEDALRTVDLDGSSYGDTDTRSLGGFSMAESMISGTTSSRFGGRQRTYQDQQNIPDAIAGFQPDMDPRLREVLEALEDEAYVDDEDDIFTELTGKAGEEVDEEEWERSRFDEEEDEGWESDRTEKAVNKYVSENDHIMPPTQEPSINTTSATADEIPPPPSTTDGDWLASFTKSKSLATAPPPVDPSTFPLATNTTTAAIRPTTNATPSLAPSSILTTSTSSPLRRGGKKRKGARTSTTNFSMTSSVLARTEPLTTLDARFDRLTAEYMNDDEFGDDDMIHGDDDEGFDDTASAATASTNRTNASRMSSMSKASMASRWSTASGASGRVAPRLVPAQFDRILDDFASGGGLEGKGKMMKKGGKSGVWGQASGMDQLDEIRKSLGPARLKS